MIPNYLRDVEAAKAKYADAWAHAHVAGDPRRHDFIKLLAYDLHQKDPKVGLNGKRGNPNDLSMDALNYLCDAADSAGRTPEGLPCAVVDCIGSAGIPSQYPVWSPFTTLVEGSGAWVTPMPVEPPAPQVEFPPRDLVGQFFAALDAKYAQRGAPNRVIGGDPLHVNNEGLFVWIAEYLRRYVTEHRELPPRDRSDAATAAVMADIDKVR